MKLLPFKLENIGEVSFAENEQFLYERAGVLKAFTFKSKDVAIRPVKALVKEIERLRDIE